MKTLAQIYSINLKPEVTGSLYTFMIKANKHVFTEILECY